MSSAKDITYSGPEYGQTCACGIDPATSSREAGYLHYVRCCKTCADEDANDKLRQERPRLSYLGEACPECGKRSIRADCRCDAAGKPLECLHCGARRFAGWKREMEAGANA